MTFTPDQLHMLKYVLGYAVSLFFLGCGVHGVLTTRERVDREKDDYASYDGGWIVLLVRNWVTTDVYVWICRICGATIVILACLGAWCVYSGVF